MRKATLGDHSFTPSTGTAGVALHVVLDDHAICSLAHHTSGTIILTKESLSLVLQIPSEKVCRPQKTLPNTVSEGVWSCWVLEHGKKDPAK